MFVRLLNKLARGTEKTQSYQQSVLDSLHLVDLSIMKWTCREYLTELFHLVLCLIIMNLKFRHYSLSEIFTITTFHFKYCLLPYETKLTKIIPVAPMFIHNPVRGGQWDHYTRRYNHCTKQWKTNWNCCRLQWLPEATHSSTETRNTTITLGIYRIYTLGIYNRIYREYRFGISMSSDEP